VDAISVVSNCVSLALSSDGRWMYGVTQTQHLIRIDPGSGQLVQDLRNGRWSLQLERAEVSAA
jgi:hypothetical protein